MFAFVVILIVSKVKANQKEFKWRVESTVLAPDGFPREVMVVLDTDKLNPTGIPQKDKPDPYKWSSSYTGESDFNNRIDTTAYQIPGPTLRVQQGDRVLVHVHNKLHSQILTLHWHRLHMYNQAYEDGTHGITECGIAPGETKVYNFTITQGPGTHWYHSHVPTQTMDGVAGTIVIDPRDGEKDPAKVLTPYDFDQDVTVRDWAHETGAELVTRYKSRIGSYEQHLNGRLEMFLPDYAWPSQNVLINGHGQTSCNWVDWEQCETVRKYGWVSTQGTVAAEPKEDRFGYLHQTDGQCMVERPPLLGACNNASAPAHLLCSASGAKASRFRLVNMGFSVPLRFWIDKHKFTIVARDGTDVVPSGPHSVIVIGIGQRYDIVVHCDQDPLRSYRAYAMVALTEAYPGAEASNFERHSYAALHYASADNGANVPFVAGALNSGSGVVDISALAAACGAGTQCRYASGPLSKPEHTPGELWPNAYGRGKANRDKVGGRENGHLRIVNEHYASYGPKFNSSMAYLPVDIQNSLLPLDKKLRTAPAAVSRILIGVSGAGNWWNNISAAMSSKPPHGRKPYLQGHNYEWWSVNHQKDGDVAKWKGFTKNASAPLHVPATPVMISNMLGESPFAGMPSSTHPEIVSLRYDPQEPLTYEVVLVNFESQQHPWHTHGYSLKVVGTGWLDDTLSRPYSSYSKPRPWRDDSTVWNENRKGEYWYTYDHVKAGFPDFNEPATVQSYADTFTLAPFSYTVLRLTANNPGAWLMHCHMDLHLDAGQGFLWSVEDANGKYDLPEPPPDYKMCNTKQGTYGFMQSAMKADKRRQSKDSSTILILSVFLGVFIVVTAVLLAIVFRPKPPSPPPSPPSPPPPPHPAKYGAVEKELEVAGLYR